MDNSTHQSSGPIQILVTGGNGFLGKRIVQELLASDSIFPDCKIRVMDLQQNSESNEVEYIRGDITNQELVDHAVQGCDIVIHSAALVDWGTRPPSEVLDVNYGGTKNVIRSCKKHGVRALVYTSSLDAVFTGKPLVDIDESAPYPDLPHSAYCESKSLSEKAIKKANDGELSAATIRPADIFGEGDIYHIGSLIDMSKKGFYVRLGDGTSLCQATYVGNCAHAHLLLAKALLNKNVKVEGKAYFITDHGPHNFFKFFDGIVAAAGYKIWPRNLWLSQPIAYFLASISEGLAFLLRPIKHYNPKFSRFAVTYTCTDFTFTSQNAVDDFGFFLKYDNQESIEMTVSYYSVESE